MNMLQQKNRYPHIAPILWNKTRSLPDFSHLSEITSVEASGEIRHYESL